MSKKIVSIITIISLIICSIGIVYAGTAQEELDKINAQKSALNKSLKEGKAVENSLNKEIKSLESQIATKQMKIKEIGANIAATEEEINKAIAELEQLEKNIASQQESLNKRLRIMYMNENSNVIDVVLGSDSISELMSNMDKIQKVYDSDQELLESLEKQHNEVKTQRSYLEGLKAQLKAAKEEQSAAKEELEADKSVVQGKKNEVASDNKALEEQIDVMNREAAALTSEILGLQGNKSFVGGEFTWPAPGISRITSAYGYRIHPVLNYKKLHTGIDIGTPTGTKIVAANSGTVIKAGWNNSYGNVIMIDHGGGKVTVYAHNSSLLVSNGQTVTKGQAIAKAGSTGMSTGPHLHFEVRINGQYVDPQSYVSYGR